MGRQVIDVRARSAASPRDLFGVLTNGRSWPEWGIWTRFDLERPGEAAPEGRGAVRVFTSRSFGRTVVSREEITELVPDRLVGYRLLSGLPMRDYRARVELTPDGDGTQVGWHAEFDRATPGLTWLYRRVMTRFLADTAQRLARYAEHHPAATA
jgi:hypothetical protein